MSLNCDASKSSSLFMRANLLPIFSAGCRVVPVLSMRTLSIMASSSAAPAEPSPSPSPETTSPGTMNCRERPLQAADHQSFRGSCHPCRHLDLNQTLLRSGTMPSRTRDLGLNASIPNSSMNRLITRSVSSSDKRPSGHCRLINKHLLFPR